MPEKNNNDSDRFKQARRVLKLLTFMQNVGKATTEEIIDYMLSEYGNQYKGIAERTVRHDILVLDQEGYIIKLKSPDKRFNVYKYVRPVAQSGISSDQKSSLRTKEAFSYHLIKPYFDKFKGTTLENDGESLKNRIESMIPGDINLDEIIYTDQNPGTYDYSIKPKVLEFLITRINNKEWISITYQKVFTGAESQKEIFPHCLYIYEGVIYLIAYNPKTKKLQSYSVQNIMDFEVSNDQNQRYPEFDIDKFREERFAVFDGETKQVKLTIRKEFAIYFENRRWHPTAKTKSVKDGSLIVEMTVPYSPDFVSWLIRWSEAIVNIEPNDLKEKVIQRLEGALTAYRK